MEVGIEKIFGHPHYPAVDNELFMVQRTADGVDLVIQFDSFREFHRISHLGFSRDEHQVEFRVERHYLSHIIANDKKRLDLASVLENDLLVFLVVAGEDQIFCDYDPGAENIPASDANTALYRFFRLLFHFFSPFYKSYLHPNAFLKKQKGYSKGMTEDDILRLIEGDPWMMKVIDYAESLHLPDWMIGAGFVRNKVWDHLHGISHEKVPTNDIDLIYFDPEHADEKADEELSRSALEATGVNWEIVNQAYAHIWHDRKEPYKNSDEALGEWVETPTCVAVSRGEDGRLRLHAPVGLEDLISLTVRHNPRHHDPEVYKRRVENKGWKEKWPKLNIIY